MVLINGILCLLAATALLAQIKKIQNQETNQFFQKFLWIYWSLLMVIAMHRIFTYLSNPWVLELMTQVSPITDTLNAMIGILLAVYLYKRRKDKLNSEKNEKL